MMNWNQVLVKAVLIAEFFFTGNTFPQRNLLASIFHTPLVPKAQLTSKKLPSIQKSRVTQGSLWSLCGRSQDDTKRVSGFTGDTAGTYISYIQVDIHSETYSTVALKWKNANSSTESLPLKFKASPGAGRCDLDCRSIEDSQKPGSRCTPLSPPLYLVQGYDCVLSKYPEAKFVTWLHWDRAIAFHAYSLPPYPASHGCIRLATKKRDAEWIYDNSLAGITQIKISWDKSEELGEKCWDGETQISRPKE
jgi:L,D-transpeptidase catalytic domain